MNVILFTEDEQQKLLPLTFMKPAGELRMGILSFRERWVKLLGIKISYQTLPYLSDLYPKVEEERNLFLNSTYFPTMEFYDALLNLKEGKALSYKSKVIAFYGSVQDFDSKNWETKEWKEDLIHIQRPYDLFQYNDKALAFDFDLITKNRISQPISDTNGIINEKNIFLEEGAKVEYAILNASEGPIYIGKDAEICEGSLVRGGLALCDHAKLNLGTKIYGTTTIGPYCKVGGEVNNSILTGYSNKGHDGFLGNSVIGEWYNLGADTNNSNLKNNYGEVKLWNYDIQGFEKTGLQFCGLIMGDHAKSAINSQFNTGTVVGPFANIFRAGFPPRKVEMFSWGGGRNDETFRLEASYEVAERMMERRGFKLTESLKKVIETLYTLRES